MTKEEILIKNGFDFELFQLENQYSAENLLLATDEYGRQCFEAARELKQVNKYGISNFAIKYDEYDDYSKELENDKT